VCRLRVGTPGAAGAVKRPAFRTPPSGGYGEGNERLSSGRTKNRGDDTRLDSVRSPDEVKRNPGFRDADSAPDFAALHPGYKSGRAALFDN
jgi:hypothetical protein